MRWSSRTPAGSNHAEPGAAMEASGQVYPVRLSILGPEVLRLLVVLVMGGFLVGLIQEWSLSSGSGSILHGHDLVVESLAFQADGRTLVSGGWDRTVRLWNLTEPASQGGRETVILPHSSHVLSVDIARDGRYVAVGDAGGFTLWSRCGENQWECVLQEKGPAQRCVALSPDGASLAIGGADGSLHVWSIPARQEVRRLGGFACEVQSVRYSSDGKHILGLAFNGDLRAWALATGRELPMSQAGLGRATAFALAPDGQRLAVSHRDGVSNRLTIIDLATCRPGAEFPEVAAQSNALAFSPDARILVSADRDGRIRRWCADVGRLDRYLGENWGWVNALAFAPDGSKVAIGCKDGSLHLQDTPPS